MSFSKSNNTAGLFALDTEVISDVGDNELIEEFEEGVGEIDVLVVVLVVIADLFVADFIVIT
jgi:hypothetical protein